MNRIGRGTDVRATEQIQHISERATSFRRPSRGSRSRSTWHRGESDGRGNSTSRRCVAVVVSRREHCAWVLFGSVKVRWVFLLFIRPTADYRDGTSGRGQIKQCVVR